MAVPVAAKYRGTRAALAWLASRPRAAPQTQPAGTSAMAEPRRVRTGTVRPFSETVPAGRGISPGDCVVGADAGPMVMTESIAPASMARAAKVAISGNIAA